MIAGVNCTAFGHQECEAVGCWPIVASLPKNEIEQGETKARPELGALSVVWE